MICETYTFDPAEGWSRPLRGELDSERTVAFVFGASRLGVEACAALDALRATLPRAVFVGCSTAGEIHGVRVLDDSLVVAVARFRAVSVEYAEAPIGPDGSSERAGEMLAGKLKRPDLRGVFVLSDGLKVNGSALATGMNRVFPPHVAVTGGLAGDGSRFERTWVLSHGEARAGLVTAVGFYGDGARIGYGSKGGWDIFGVERLVTRASGNVLYELDGKPALALYKSYLGERAEGLPATGLLFPLSLRPTSTDEKRLVRTILAADEATQSLTFAGDIPTGSRVRLMRANFDRLVEGAAQAGDIARQRGGTEAPSLVIAVSCVGRRLALGERTEEEIEAVAEAFPTGTPQVGFYSYGELSPFAQGPCDLHNQTMALTTLAEIQDSPR